MKIFLIGYEGPMNYSTPVSESDKRKIEKMMREADAAAVGMPEGWPNGWPIGKTLQLADGRTYVCTGHEHEGKLVTVRPVEPSS